MESEESYFRQMVRGNMNASLAIGQTDAPTPSTIADEAGLALNAADSLHSMLDDLEVRLFGPEPRAVGAGIDAKQAERPALAHTVRGTRQRLDSAAERVSRILGRL